MWGLESCHKKQGMRGVKVSHGDIVDIMEITVMRRNNKPLCKQQQKGMTLIEVLVSMLVIGLALAMSISMIQTANRYGASAEYSAAGLQQAQSIIDKMRANKIGAPAYLFASGASAGGSYDAWYKVDMEKIPNDLVCGDDDQCKGVLAVAKADMEQWKVALESLLPGGKGVIRETAAGSGSYQVIVMWKYNPESEARNAEGNNPDANGITVNFSL